MTNARNIPAEGEPVSTVDVRAPTFARALQTAQADAFGVLELITGEYEGDDIDHTGPPRGALIGQPTNISMGFGLRLTPGAGKQGGTDGEDLIFPFLHPTSRGEIDLCIDVVFSGSVGPEAAGMRVRDLISGEEYRFRDRDEIPGQPRTYRAFMPIASASACRVLAVVFFGVPRRTTISDIPATYTDEVLEAVMVHPNRVGPTSAVTSAEQARVRVPAPSSTDAINFLQLGESMFAVDDAITGYHVTTIDGNLNALEEYQNGSPAGGNAAYTQTESALQNPTRSRFRAFTRKTLTDERVPLLHVGSWAFGGIKENGDCLAGSGGVMSTSPNQGSLTGFAPYPTTGTKTIVGRVRVQIPDIPTSVGLFWAVVLGKHVVGNNWSNTTVGVQVDSSTEIDADFAAPVIGSGAQAPAIAATGPLLPFPTRDGRAFISVNLTLTGTYALGDHSLIALAVWADGTEP